MRTARIRSSQNSKPRLRRPQKTPRKPCRCLLPCCLSRLARSMLRWTSRRSAARTVRSGHYWASSRCSLPGSRVLMVLEDAHWFDPTSLEIFSLTVERITSLPVLLVITARPEFAPPWPSHAYVSTVTLNRLGQHEGEALAFSIA